MNLFVVVGTITTGFIETKTSGCYEFFLEEDDDYNKVFTHKFVIWEKALPKFRSLEGHLCAIKGIIRPSKFGNFVNENLLVRSIEVLDLIKTDVENNKEQSKVYNKYKKSQQPQVKPAIKENEEVANEVSNEKPSDEDIEQEDLPF